MGFRKFVVRGSALGGVYVGRCAVHARPGDWPECEYFFLANYSLNLPVVWVCDFRKFVHWDPIDVFLIRLTVDL